MVVSTGRTILILFFCLLLKTSLLGQKDCYVLFEKLAIQAFENHDFFKASQLYEAARVCDDIAPEKIETIEKMIKDSRSNYVKALDKARRQAVREKSISDSLALEADHNRKIAEWRARESEANRLAYLARGELRLGNDTTAIYLAQEALRIKDTLDIPMVEEIFGNTVMQYFKRPLPCDSCQIEIASFTPDGGRIIGFGQHSRMYLWDETGTALVANRSFNQPIWNKEFDINTKEWLILSDSGSLHIINYYGQDAGSLFHPEATGCSFSNDANMVASYDRFGKVILWSRNDSKVKTIPLHEGPILNLDFNSTNDRFLTRSADKSVILYDLSKDTALMVKQNASYIRAASFFGINNDWYTYSFDSVVTVYNSSGLQVGQLSFKSKIKSVHTPDDCACLVAISDGNEIKIMWPDKTGYEMDLAGNYPNVNIHANNKELTILSWNSNQLRIFKNAELIREIDLAEEPSNIIRSRNGKLFLVINSNANSFLMNSVGKTIMNLGIGVQNGQFSPDGKYILITDEEHQPWITPIPSEAKKMLNVNPAPSTKKSILLQFGISG